MTYLCLSISTFLCLFFLHFTSVCLSSLVLFVCLSVYIRMSVSVFVCLSVFTCQSFCIVCLSMCLSVCLRTFVSLYIVCLSVSVFFFVSVCCISACTCMFVCLCLSHVFVTLLRSAIISILKMLSLFLLISQFCMSKTIKVCKKFLLPQNMSISAHGNRSESLMSLPLFTPHSDLLLTYKPKSKVTSSGTLILKKTERSIHIDLWFSHDYTLWLY